MKLQYTVDAGLNRASVESQQSEIQGHFRRPHPELVCSDNCLNLSVQPTRYITALARNQHGNVAASMLASLSSFEGARIHLNILIAMIYRALSQA